MEAMQILGDLACHRSRKIGDEITLRALEGMIHPTPHHDDMDNDRKQRRNQECHCEPTSNAAFEGV